MSKQYPQDDETLRNEIQAAIKAGREVDPDMDEHLADSVLERYRQEQAARSKALAPQRPATPPAPSGTNNGEIDRQGRARPRRDGGLRGIIPCTGRCGGWCSFCPASSGYGAGGIGAATTTGEIACATDIRRGLKDGMTRHPSSRSNALSGVEIEESGVKAPGSCLFFIRATRHSARA